MLGLLSGPEAMPASELFVRPFDMHRQTVPVPVRQTAPGKQRGFLNSVFSKTVHTERLLFRFGSPIKMPPHFVRDRCAFGMSSDSFRACETRKGEVWLLKFDWWQLQTRGKTELSKEVELIQSGYLPHHIFYHCQMSKR